MSITSGGSPWTQSAAAASIAPSMQCAVRVRSTTRTGRQVSPFSSKFCPRSCRKRWIFCGESRRRSTANSARVRPRSSRRANLLLLIGLQLDRLRVQQCDAAAHEVGDHFGLAIAVGPGDARYAGAERVEQLAALALARGAERGAHQHLAPVFAVAHALDVAGLLEAVDDAGD